MTLRRHNPQRSTRGFTLLEILIATAVGAIVLLVINGAFFGALRLSNTTHESISTHLELERALGLIRKDLAGIMLPKGALSGQLQTTTGTSLTQENYGDQVGPDLYTNTGSIDGWNPFSEVQLVQYYLSASGTGNQGRQLLRVVTRNLLPVQTTTPEVQTLLKNVSSAEIAFYDGTQWTDTWDSTDSSTLPSALRFSLTQANTSGTQTTPAPIELVVPVLVMTVTSQTQATSGGSSQ